MPAGTARANRLDAKLEGRDIDGVLTPTNNFVLVKVADILDETDGGILLTGSVSVYGCSMICLFTWWCLHYAAAIARNMISLTSYYQTKSIEY